jgi:hypothetical protein
VEEGLVAKAPYFRVTLPIQLITLSDQLQSLQQRAFNGGESQFSRGNRSMRNIKLRADPVLFFTGEIGR